MKRMELRVEGEALKGKRFAVPASGLRLGRSSSNDIPVRDEELSRNHCLFEQSGECGIRVTDLASANGTFVNEVRLGAESAELKPGDVIRVGATFITVVDKSAAPAEFDLGLGDKVTSRKKAEGENRGTADDKDSSATSNRKLLNVLWAIVVVALGAAIWVMLNPQNPPAVPSAEIVEESPTLVAMRYERVEADSEAISRYSLTLSPDGVLHAVIDYTAGEGRHVDRREPLSDEKKDRLLKLISSSDITALDRAYTGSDEEPPRLKSWALSYYTTSTRKDVKIVNTQEPDAFRAMRGKLEEFAADELRIRGMQYSREELIARAHTAGDSGREKWEDRDVANGNLHESIRFYREAMDHLETVNPKPPEYEEYRKAKERAEAELKKRLEDKRFAIDQAINIRQWQEAKEMLIEIRDMMPDREDDTYRWAEKKLFTVENHLGKNGGRR